MTNALYIPLWIGVAAVIFIQLRKHAPANRRAAELRRSPSFSYVFFKGDVSQHILSLLEACQYKVLETSRVKKTSLCSLFDTLPAPSGSNNSIVSKAYCMVGNYTVLCDPEMVFLTYLDELAQFCSAHLTQAFVAAWERISQTVALSQISAAGVIRQSFYIAGQAKGEQKQPHKMIQQCPDEAGLLGALAEQGIPLTDMGQEVEATVLKLQE